MEAQAETTYDMGSLIEASGCRHLFRSFRMAVQPTKLLIALAAILLTLLYGALLDAIATGISGGSSLGTINAYIESVRTNTAYEPAEGDYGPFAIFWGHERRGILGLLGSSVPATSVAAGSPAVDFGQEHQLRSPVGNLAQMVYGIRWLFTEHFIYMLVFGLGGLFIWSLAGGAICRMAALQFARDEITTFEPALGFAWKRIGSLFFGPCFPLGLIALGMLGIAVLGLLMAIPYLGDLLSILAVPIALFMGFFILAPLVIGLFVGGPLFWPAVATDNVDAFNAASRALGYALPKPWKTAIYAVITVVYAGVCLLLVKLFLYLALLLVRACASFGSSPFGAFDNDRGASKIEVLWPMGGINDFYSWPGWESLTIPQYLSALVVGLALLLVMGLVWSFIASFFFCSSTIGYFRLRRDIDGTDLEEVYVEEEEAAEPTPATAPPAQAAATSSTEPVPPSAPDAPASTDDAQATQIESSDEKKDESPENP
jgi:hypothetical protein